MIKAILKIAIGMIGLMILANCSAMHQEIQRVNHSQQNDAILPPKDIEVDNIMDDEKILQSHEIANESDDYTENMNPPLDSIAYDDAESPESRLGNEDYIHQIQTAIMTHLDTFNHTFSARLGVIVLSLKDQKIIMAHHEHECFIPASLTKLVVSSALFNRLNQISEDNPDHAFDMLIQALPIHSPSLTHLSTVLTQMNHYTVSQAPQANRMAETLGDLFIQSHIQQTGEYVTLEQLLLNHIDLISFKENCNRIDSASGLSVTNQLTPSQIAACMVHLYAYPVFVHSLIQPGQGTLTHRLLDTNKNNYFKTGSLRQTGVLCLAGYIEHPISLCFVIMINQLNPRFFNQGVQWIDDFIRIMTE